MYPPGMPVRLSSRADALPHRAVEELKPETSGSGKVERQRTSEGEPPRRIDVRDGVAWRRREEVERTRRDPIDGRDFDLAGRHERRNEEGHARGRRRGHPAERVGDRRLVVWW